MAFQQGLSGLNATSKALEVIGHNIANANTFGAKASRAEFSDMYAAALNGAGANSIGIGVRLAAVAQQFTQGNISVSEHAMDLAINGAGFFQVTDGNNPPLFSRNGQFKVDREGFLVNNQGLQLMGYPADGTGTIRPGAAVALQLPTAGVPPQATSDIRIEFNLDSRAGPVATAPAVNFADPTTYNNATSMTAYDAKGQEIAVTYYFQKAGTDSWNVFATANGSTLAGTAAAPTPITTVNFPPNGSAPTAPAAPFAINIPSATNINGAQTMAVPGVMLDVKGMTQYGSGFTVSNVQQDGYSAGQLSSITIEGNGIVLARYSNGQSKPAGQIELATFRNPQGLQPLGDNVWGRTFASGDPTVSTPGVGNYGSLQSGALEESNVDLTGELVGMIVAQRVYQANAQTVKTQDSVLQTLVSMR